MCEMDREQAQELFSAYREGELPPDKLADFEAFLSRDHETREEYDRFCRAIDSLALLRKQEAPDDFLEKLQSRMRRRSAGKLFGQRWGQSNRVPYEFFSLVLILIILTVYMLTLPVLQVPPPETEGDAAGTEPGD